MEQQPNNNTVPTTTNPQPPAAPAAATHIVVQPTMPAPQPEPRPSGSARAGTAPGPLADARGSESTPSPGQKPTAEQLREALKEVYDPEIPINVVDLGLIYKLEENNGVVEIDMTLTSPHCPIGDQIAEQVRETIRTLPGIMAVKVNLTFEPLWTKEMITADGRLQASMLGLM